MVKKGAKPYQPPTQTRGKKLKFDFKTTGRTKKMSNISQVHRPDYFTKKDALENKENLSSNVQKNSRTPGKRIVSGLDLSISSVSKSSSGKKASRYIEKSSILKNMSPTRRGNNHSNNASHDTFLLVNRMNGVAEHPDNHDEEAMESPPRFRGSSMPHNAREDYKQLRAKRTTPTHKGQKSFRVDRIVRENLKKKKQKEEVEHMKKQLEDMKSKQKKQVLS